MTFKFKETLVSKSVFLNNASIIISGDKFLVLGSRTNLISSALSSLTSDNIGRTLLSISSAIFSNNLLF